MNIFRRKQLKFLIETCLEVLQTMTDRHICLMMCTADYLRFGQKSIAVHPTWSISNAVPSETHHPALTAPVLPETRLCSPLRPQRKRQSIVKDFQQFRVKCVAICPTPKFKSQLGKFQF